MIVTDTMMQTFLEAFGADAARPDEDLAGRVKAGLEAVLPTLQRGGKGGFDPRRLFDGITDDRTLAWDAAE